MKTTYDIKNIDKAKGYNVKAYGEKPRHIWNNICGRYEDMPKVTKKHIVIVNYNTFLKDYEFSIYDASDLNEDERLYLVREYCRFITKGCNYTYKVSKVINNVYFCK